MELKDTFPSIVKAAKYFNPKKVKKKETTRGVENAICRAKNKKIFVSTKLGKFIFAEYPSSNRWAKFTKGKYPLIIVDLA